MKWEDVKRILEEEEISPEAYSLFGDGLGDCFVLAKDKQGWIVYYSERGERYGIKFFQNEDEACECFLKEILSSSGSRHKVFSRFDFEHYPIWEGNDNKGYHPVFEKEPSLLNCDNELFIKAIFSTKSYVFDGYLVGGDNFTSCGLFIRGELIRLNTKFPVFTDGNLKLLFQLLGCKPFDFFPLHYESSVRLRGGHRIYGDMIMDIHK